MLSFGCNFLQFSIQQLGMTLFTKVGTEFRQLFKVPQIDWCTLMAGQKNSNAIWKSWLTSFRAKFPQLFSECPFIGYHELLNIRPNKVLATIYPTGVTQFIFYLCEGKKLKLTASVFLEIFK
jgi:hypothetical protein